MRAITFLFILSMLVFGNCDITNSSTDVTIKNPYHDKWVSMYGSLKGCCGCDCQCGDCPQPCSDCPVGFQSTPTVDLTQIKNPYHYNWISMYGSLKGCCGCDCQCGDCPQPCSDCPPIV